MIDLFWLSDEQMARLDLFFPKSYRTPCIDGHKVLGEIIFMKLNALPWYDAPKEFGAAKTLYNVRKRWSEIEMFARRMLGLADGAADPTLLMIDATYLRTHRSARSLRVSSEEQRIVQGTVSLRTGGPNTKRYSDTDPCHSASF
ncbi:transposase [Paracoccus aestuariivivens]|uniref:Transposase n=1 Tax=Paracoccus aestuariivivens TaxID=1820333 RepID=A0A6L6JCG4_9RHOB|nr:transposase [Paracoccus aestuariivivens]MTH78895.1 transposase [Paracoccus aestuariivivens]